MVQAFGSQGVLGVFLLVGFIALALVLATNATGVSSVIGAIGNSYSAMLKAAEGH